VASAGPFSGGPGELPNKAVWKKKLKKAVAVAAHSVLIFIIVVPLLRRNH
jgi:hypothetical protein